VLAGAYGWWLLAPTGEPAVAFPGGADFGISLPSTMADKPYSIGAIALCVNGVDSAIVDSVQPGPGAALTVSAFAVRPHMGTFGAEQVSLRAAGFGNGRVVTGQCSAGEGSEIGVEFTKPGSATARTDGLLVHWHTGSSSGITRVPLHLVLCQGRDPAVASCESIR